MYVYLHKCTCSSNLQFTVYILTGMFMYTYMYTSIASIIFVHMKAWKPNVWQLYFDTLKHSHGHAHIHTNTHTSVSVGVPVKHQLSFRYLQSMHNK